MVVVELLRISVSPVVQVCLICAVGFLGARFPAELPLLSPAALRVLARLANDVFLPALTVAVVGAAVDLTSLRRDWALFPAGVVVTALGFAVADCTALVFKPRLQGTLRVSIAHPNSFALPLLVLQSLCERSVVNADFDDDAGKCTARAAASLNVYLTAWHLCFWTYSITSLENHSFSVREMATRALYQPNIIALVLGLALGISPLSAALFRDGHRSPLRPVGAAIQTLGEPLVAVTTLLMAAALANGRKGAAQVVEDDRKTCSLDDTPARSSSENQAAMSSSLEDASPNSHREPRPAHLNEEEEEEEKRGRSGAHITDGEAPVVPPPPERRLDSRTASWFVLSRLVVTPLLGYSVAHLFRGRTFGMTKMTRLVILLELAMPGAQTVIVTLSALGMNKRAEQVAPYYFVQYGSAIFSLTAFSAWALLLVYHS